MPRVSVVLPTYDAAGHVSTALDSILEGTYDDIEVLVIDDGSTDGTRDTVGEYAERDPRVNLIERDETGLPSALNRGIEAASGTYVARHDADDRSLPGRVDRQVSFLDDNPEVVLVGSGVYIEDATGRCERRHVIEDLGMTDFRQGNPIIHGSVMFRREPVAAIGGYDTSLPVSEDYDLWIRLAASHQLRNIDEPLYELRLHGGSIYESDLERVKLARRYAWKRLHDDLPADAVEAVERHGVLALQPFLAAGELAALHRQMAMESLRYGDPESGRRHAWTALRLAPDVAAPALLGLSLAPRPAISVGGSLYRTVKNFRIRWRNRMGGVR